MLLGADGLYPAFGKNRRRNGLLMCLRLDGNVALCRETGRNIGLGPWLDNAAPLRMAKWPRREPSRWCPAGASLV